MSASAAPAPDATCCPLCGQPNTCAITAGLPAQGCWCMSAPVSRAALARLAPEQRGRACICPACAQGAAAPVADKIGPAPPPPSSAP
ncbi:cysteine-rich CWC family protein [Melaminivora jejuensis]|uniref:cysteine-rich CWC family protein n=1 Tax=Melaminivora jejuensis TaxID=1267217 RepID=UPI001ADFDD0E|nr:cysteine-rich CWC family protein [Melaminivora jejuensis]UHJ65232.1 cysteine-rich CWC family protein [Melaminivora jejuensis]